MNKGLEELKDLKNAFIGHCRELKCETNYIKVCENKFSEIENELKDYYEIKEAASHYGWDDMVNKVFNFESDRIYRDLFNAGICSIQADYRKARAFEIIKKAFNSSSIYTNKLKDSLECGWITQEEYDFLKGVLL